METVGGWGTILYGKKNFDKESGYFTATEWVVIFFLPIIPLKTYRVRRGDTYAGTPEGSVLSGTSTEFEMIKIKLDWKQVITTFFIKWAMGIAIMAILYWISGLY